MPKAISFTNSVGDVVICLPAPNDRQKGETEDEQIQRVIDNGKSIPSGSSDIDVIDTATLPNREWRNAWKKAGVGAPITIDMDIARATQLRRIARAKEDLEQQYDDEETAALARNDNAAAVVAAAKRDNASAVDLKGLAVAAANAPNITALRNIWPAALDDSPQFRELMERTG